MFVFGICMLVVWVILSIIAVGVAKAIEILDLDDEDEDDLI